MNTRDLNVCLRCAMYKHMPYFPKRDENGKLIVEFWAHKCGALHETWTVDTAYVRRDWPSELVCHRHSFVPLSEEVDA